MQSRHRHQRILDILKTNGSVSVGQLVKEFDTSPQTIRADLRDLDAAKKLVRIHGGARSIDRRENLEYEARRQIAADEKIAIGKAAGNLISNNSSLLCLATTAVPSPR